MSEIIESLIVIIMVSLYPLLIGVLIFCVMSRHFSMAT